MGVEEEYVIVGNDAIMKCKIPSFVADFVSVVSWQDAEGNEYFLSARTPQGKETISSVDLVLDLRLSTFMSQRHTPLSKTMLKICRILLLYTYLSIIFILGDIQI